MRYEKGRKDATRRNIIAVAARRFREDGIAATGLAGVMSEAGLTNGAFYPHFSSKGDLVAACVTASMEEQGEVIQQALDAGGLDRMIAAYLSAEHRDDPGHGCPSAALLPEIARQPGELHERYTERLMVLVKEIAAALPPGTENRPGVAFGVLATLIGSLQLARAVEGADLSDSILDAGATAARQLVAG
ncbi:MAG TPA: TetR/AcrR family transcriptional regulator [Devosia sp.]